MPWTKDAIERLSRSSAIKSPNFLEHSVSLSPRPTDDIRTDLLNAPHVRYRSLDIHGDTNQRDIALYIRDRLHYVSSRRQLRVDWPGEQRINEFTRQAGGLFVWVSTISKYLLTAAYPDRKLSILLCERNLSCLRAPVKPTYTFLLGVVIC